MLPEETGRIGCSVFKIYFKVNQKNRRQTTAIIIRQKTFLAFLTEQLFRGLKGIFYIILIFLI